jgi:hypothetical protein
LDSNFSMALPAADIATRNGRFVPLGQLRSPI